MALGGILGMVAQVFWPVNQHGALGAAAIRGKSVSLGFSLDKVLGVQYSVFKVT